MEDPVYLPEKLYNVKYLIYYVECISVILAPSLFRLATTTITISYSDLANTRIPPPLTVSFNTINLLWNTPRQCNDKSFGSTHYNTHRLRDRSFNRSLSFTSAAADQGIKWTLTPTRAVIQVSLGHKFVLQESTMLTGIDECFF